VDNPFMKMYGHFEMTNFTVVRKYYRIVTDRLLAPIFNLFSKVRKFVVTFLKEEVLTKQSG